MGKKLTFVDLFAGIGGFHLALKSLDMKSVFACEIDKYARQTYVKNFNDVFLKDPELFPEDIWSVELVCFAFLHTAAYKHTSINPPILFALWGLSMSAVFAGGL